MKKLALLLVSIFCVSFAANAQLKIQNESLLFNVPDGYPNFGNSTVFYAGMHVFIGPQGASPIVISGDYGNMCFFGPMTQGVIAFSAGHADFHDVYLKNVFNISDARAKTNIRSISSATNTILRLNPITYNFLSRSNDKSTHMVSGADGMETGFLAQEVAEVLPNSVALDTNGNYLVNYISVIPILTKAIQELNARVEVLERENATLKNR